MKKGIITSVFTRQRLTSVSLVILSVFYGVYAHKQHHLVAVVIEDALETQLTLFKNPWYLISAADKKSVPVLDNKTIQPGLTKLVHFSGENSLAVSVVEANGTLVQQWPIDWFTIWPDARHLSYFMQPKSRPGTMVHGAEILPDGDLVFNFEYLGMVRLDPCGNVVWRLPRQTHHSVFIDEQGFIWTGENKVRKNTTLQQTLHEPYYVEPFILKIAPDGKVVAEKSVFDILTENGMSAALYLSSIDNDDPVVRGDTLHLNDVEVFPSTMKPGFFQPGDIMISLRNINTLLVLEPVTWKIKHSISNLTLRQHDPDFIDSNTLRVYDNNNRFYKGDTHAYSRIVSISAPENTVKVLFQGSPAIPFYSKILGKQQTLDNGNLLLSNSRNGNVIEITPDHALAWEFTNMIDDNLAAVIQEAERLPATMDKAFFTAKAGSCQPASKPQ